MSADSMVERVARAICAKDGSLSSCEGDGRCAAGDQCPYPTLARAAIAALREPTEAMVDECYGDSFNDWYGEGASGGEAGSIPALIWKTMIDAALSKHEEAGAG